METNDPVRAAEVMAVLEAETRAFYAKDFDAFSACWAPEPHVRRGGWWQRGGIAWLRRGGEVMADLACVTFVQYSPDAGEPDMDMPGLSHETRILERRGGRWVIVYMSDLLVGCHHRAAGERAGSPGSRRHCLTGKPVGPRFRGRTGGASSGLQSGPRSG